MLIQILSWLGAVQGTLMIVLFLNSKQNKLANRFMAGFLAILVGDCLEPVVIEEYNFELWAVLWGGLTFLHGPLLYLYLRLSAGLAQTKRDYIQLTTPLIYYLILVVGSLIDPDESVYSAGSLIIYELFFVHLFVYVILSMRLINKRLSEVSNASDFYWHRNLVMAIAVLYATSFAVFHVTILDGADYLDSFRLIIQFIVITVVYFISYRLTSNYNFDLQSKDKYKTSSLDLEKIRVLKETVVEFMASRKPYLNADLSLQKLSELTGINKYHLSQVINSELSQNFYDFVNQYRVEEVKRLINNPRKRNYTIMGLAHEAGFRSKSTFNSIFKKFTGQTPSQYYKSVKQTVE